MSHHRAHHHDSSSTVVIIIFLIIVIIIIITTTNGINTTRPTSPVQHDHAMHRHEMSIPTWALCVGMEHGGVELTQRRSRGEGGRFASAAVLCDHCLAEALPPDIEFAESRH